MANRDSPNSFLCDKKWVYPKIYDNVIPHEATLVLQAREEYPLLPWYPASTSEILRGLHMGYNLLC